MYSYEAEIRESRLCLRRVHAVDQHPSFLLIPSRPQTPDMVFGSPEIDEAGRRCKSQRNIQRGESISNSRFLGCYTSAKKTSMVSNGSHIEEF